MTGTRFFDKVFEIYQINCLFRTVDIFADIF